MSMISANWGDGNHRPPGLSDADIAILSRAPLFEGVENEELLYLIDGAKIETFEAGRMLFLHGDPARSFFVVLSGWIKLYRSTAEGAESIIALISDGESFAEAAAFADCDFPVSASSVEASRLLVVPAAPFVEKIVADGRLAIKMLASMSVRLRQLVHQVEELSLKTSRERLAAYLATLCVQESGSAEIVLPFDKALIARHLGMQPETLSRSFARLKNDGIHAEGERIFVNDIGKLRELSGEVA